MLKSSFVAAIVVVIVVVAPGRKAIFVDYQTIHHCVCRMIKKNDEMFQGFPLHLYVVH